MRRQLKAHRVLDVTRAVPIPPISYGAVHVTGWKPFTPGWPATQQVASIPSLAHAIALELIPDVVTDPTLLDANTLHLTPEGNRIETGFPIRDPKYVYVVGFVNGLPEALAAGYPALAALGVRLVTGRALSYRTSNTNAVVMPISGASQQSFFSTQAIVADDEPDEYEAGDLFVAVVQDDWSTLVFSGQGIFGNNVAGNTANYCFTNGNGFTPPDYSIVETVGSQGLFVGAALAGRDADLAAVHIARYRSFRQKFYLPDAAIATGFGTDTYSTDGPTLLGLVNPAGHPFATYQAGLANDLAALILDDAATFFA